MLYSDVIYESRTLMLFDYNSDNYFPLKINCRTFSVNNYFTIMEIKNLLQIDTHFILD